MSSGDALPIPRKNVAYRITFPILDADGDLVTGATALDSEVSKDGGTYTDCTNEATEIAANSGMYFLDLTADEMNADTVAIIVKTSTSGAKTTPIVLYPEETGDIRVKVTQMDFNTLTADAIAQDAKQEIADQVWDEPKIGHGVADTFGEEIQSHSTHDDPDPSGFIDAAISSRSSHNDPASDIAAIQSDTDDIQTRLPAALVGGRIDASVGAMAAVVLTAAAIAADAITAANIAPGAIAKGDQLTGLNDLSAAQVNVEADTALSDYDAPTKAEMDNAHALLATVNAIWDELTAETRVADSYGQLIKDNIDAPISGATAPDENVIADAVLSRPISNVEPAAFRTLYGAIASLVNRSRINNLNQLEIYKVDDTTILVTIPGTVDSALLPIRELNPP